MRRHTQGITLIETLVSAAIFLVVGVALYQTYTGLFRVVSASRIVLSASSLATEQFEVVRNLSYEDVGVSGSIPDGVIPHVQEFARDGVLFTATTTVRNVDDPFDGTIGGAPNDTSPADYKLVQIEIGCGTCRNFEPHVFTTRVAPKALEGSSTNGALFIRVFDANGVPVQGADVHVENNATTTPISIDDVTDANGMLQLVDIPPGVGAYEIAVTKSGYSTDQTYTPGGAQNPNPTKPHSTVAAGQVTQVSFTIDVLSQLSIESMTQTCAPVASVNLDLTGAKLIGTEPDVLKYDASLTTDGAGQLFVNNLEWDTYGIAVTDVAYDLAGLIPFLPPSIAPDSELDVRLIVSPQDANALLVTVEDTATGLPVSDATVVLNGSDTKVTGQGFLTQTDWSGGPGQQSFVNETEYYSSDGGVDVITTPGVIQLDASGGVYDSSGELVSSAFDTGSASNFYQIVWQPSDQPVDSGPDSVRFQVASAIDDTATTTWTFTGPDDTAATYYTTSNQNLSAAHSGNRYFRYKAFLSTTGATSTPTVSDVSFVFTSECVPPGQVLFGGLSSGTHTVTVTKSGYQAFSSDPIDASTDFTSYEASLIPE